MTELEAFVAMLKRAKVKHTQTRPPYSDDQWCVRITGHAGFIGAHPEFYFGPDGSLGVPNMGGGKTCILNWPTK